MRFILSAIFVLGLTSSAQAQDCPSTIYYQSGQLMKNGSAFYYENGQLLKNGSALWYSNGQLLKNGTALYYENGQLLKNGSARWYSNGQLMKNGSALYYRNGQLLKNGNAFWHANGQLAKNGSTLYRENGSMTVFPITLEEHTEDGIHIYAYLTKDSADVETSFDGFSFASQLVSGNMVLEGDDPQFDIFLNTGAAGEYIYLTAGQTSTCELYSHLPAPTRFTIDTNVAEIQVEVKKRLFTTSCAKSPATSTGPFGK